MKIDVKNLAGMSDRRSGYAPLVMPNLISSNFVAEQLGKVNRDFQLIPDVPVREVEDAESRLKDSLSVVDQLGFAEQHGYLACILVGFYPLVDLAASRFPHLRWDEQREDLGPQLHRSRKMRTPFGELSEQSSYDKKTQFTHRREEVLKSEADIRAYEWLVLESVEAVVGDWEAIRLSLKKEMTPKIEDTRGRGFSAVHFWTPITEVFVPFLDQASALYFLHDHPSVARRLMDAVSTYTLRLVDLFNEVGVDLQGTALWGYETFNPAIYREYILPYVKPVAENIRRGEKSLFWVHTCGRMKGLLEERVYSRFEVDLLECLNYPPAGDVDDWVRLRSLLSDSVITKGNLEDSLLWQGPTEEIRRKTREILVQSENFRHILGTSNNVFDGTPLANFLAMLEAVSEFARERGLRELP